MYSKIGTRAVSGKDGFRKGNVGSQRQGWNFRQSNQTSDMGLTGR